MEETLMPSLDHRPIKSEPDSSREEVIRFSPTSGNGAPRDHVTDGRGDEDEEEGRRGVNEERGIVEMDRIKKESEHQRQPPTQIQPPPAVPAATHRGHRFQCHICKAEFSSVVQLTRHAKSHRRSTVRKCKLCCKVLRKDSSEVDVCERCYEAEMRVAQDEVRGHAHITMDEVKGHARTTFDEVKGHARTTMDEVKGHARTTMDEVKGHARITDEVIGHSRTSVDATESRIKDIASRMDTDKNKNCRLERAFTCHEGEKIFMSADALESHCLKSHKEKECFFCKVCKKMFWDKSALDAHVKKQHGSEKPYVCQTCGKSYSRKHALQEHEVTHSEKPLFKCDICKREFKVRRTRDRHKKKCSLHSHNTQTNDSVHACTYCSKTFPTQNDSNAHLREFHRDKAHVCEICGACFTAKSSLVIHHRAHTGYKPYKCDVCEKSFGRGHHLKVHQRLHTDEMPYACDKCGRGFKRKDHLTLHQRTHEEGRRRSERPYKSWPAAARKFVCEMDGCGKRFHRKSQLLLHNKRLHKKN